MTDILGKTVEIGDKVVYAKYRLSTTIFAIGEIDSFTKTMARIKNDGNVKLFYKIEENETEEHINKMIKIFQRLQ